MEPQDGVPESRGAVPGAYQGSQEKKQWQLEDALCPQNLQKRVVGDYWVKREDLEGS